MNVTDFAGPKARALCKAVAKSKSTVGVLFVGEPGAGQDTLASELAKALLCTAGEDGSACGSCTACTLFDKSISPDYLDIRPIGPSDIIRLGLIDEEPQFDKSKEKVQPNAHEFACAPPIQSTNKVVTIRRAERMNGFANNALLKLLEEPPDYVRFVLTTAALSKVEPTIRSRCVLVPCDYSVATTNSFIATASGGAPEIEEQLGQDRMSPFVTALEEFWASLRSRKPAEALVVSEQFQDLVSLYKEGYGKEIEGRFANADVIHLFANVVAKQGATSMLEKLIVMHKQVQGNASFSYLCDSLFMSEL